MQTNISVFISRRRNSVVTLAFYTPHHDANTNFCRLFQQAVKLDGNYSQRDLRMLHAAPQQL
jgi:hypothetical protein